MSIRDRDPVFETLENLQEEPVLDMLRRRLPEVAGKRPGVCSCARCLTDMAALALNALPPRYVADRYNKFPEDEVDEERNRDLVQRAVDTAIARVAGRPHH